MGPTVTESSNAVMGRISQLWRIFWNQARDYGDDPTAGSLGPPGKHQLALELGDTDGLHTASVVVSSD